MINGLVKVELEWFLWNRNHNVSLMNGCLDYNSGYGIMVLETLEIKLGQPNFIGIWPIATNKSIAFQLNMTKEQRKNNLKIW